MKNKKGMTDEELKEQLNDACIKQVKSPNGWYFHELERDFIDICKKYKKSYDK